MYILHITNNNNSYRVLILVLLLHHYYYYVVVVLLFGGRWSETGREKGKQKKMLWIYCPVGTLDCDFWIDSLQIFRGFADFSKVPLKHIYHHFIHPPPVHKVTVNTIKNIIINLLQLTNFYFVVHRVCGTIIISHHQKFFCRRVLALILILSSSLSLLL